MSESEDDKYRRMVENANEAIFVAQDLTMKFCNPKTCEILGYTSDQLMSRPFDRLIHKDDRQRVLERYKKRLGGENIEDFYSFKALHGSGKIIWVEIKPVRLIWDDRPATLNFMSDISQRKQAEAERKRLEEQLYQAQKMEAIGALAGGIAHDFNNILGAITGYTELTVSELPEDSIEFANLEQVLAAAGRAKELVRQILAFSRKVEQETKPVYIGQLIKEAAKLLRSSLPATIQLDIKINDHLSPVLADPTRIHQVLMNLCTNAAHAMRGKGGCLSISLTEKEKTFNEHLQHHLQSGRYQKLTVGDTGHGMNEETRRRIFEPYFTTKQEGEGTGLGLAVVHGIVKSHCGYISVASKPGKGTRFHVYFPVTEKGKAKPNIKSQPIKKGKETILYVDDEKPLADMGKLMLERLGYHVHSFTSSVDALDAFQAGPGEFDLIISDQTMPYMTGIQLASAVKAVCPDTPVILSTGFSDLIDEKNYKEHGVDGFVMKPIVLCELADIIRRLLDKS